MKHTKLRAAGALAVSACLSFAANAATLVVNTTSDLAADDGACSLREAIVAANTNLASGALAGECAAGEAAPVKDTVSFAIPGGGLKTIQPAAGGLPIVATPMIIDGYTQPEANENTLPLDALGRPTGSNAVLRIEIDGTLSGNVAAIRLGPGAAGAVVQGLAINRVNDPACCADSGIFVDAPDAVIRGNFIGTDATGLIASPLGARAIFIDNDADGLAVGGTTPGDVNVLGPAAFNAIAVSGPTNMSISGNMIGYAANATTVLSSPAGINISGEGIRVVSNLIASDIAVEVAGSTDVTVQSNRIGPSSRGVVVRNSNGGPATQSVVEDNDFTGYTANAVLVYTYNPAYVVDRHVVRANRFDGGASSYAIDLAAPASNTADGPTANDVGDTDTGSNGLTNHPVLASADYDDVTQLLVVPYTLDNAAGGTYTIELYAATTCAASGRGPRAGGRAVATVDALAPTAQGTLTFTPSAQTGFVTAIVTGAEGTSEFSPCVPYSATVLLSDGFESP